MPSVRPSNPIVENRTRWRNADVKKFTLRGWKAEGCSPSVLVVCFTESINSYRFNGLAHVAGRDYGRIVLSLPRGFTGNEWDIVSLAQVYLHEIAHLRGLDHVDMSVWTSLDVPWAEELTWQHKKGFIRQPERERIERQIKDLTLELDLL